MYAKTLTLGFAVLFLLAQACQSGSSIDCTSY